MAERKKVKYLSHQPSEWLLRLVFQFYNFCWVVLNVEINCKRISMRMYVGECVQTMCTHVCIKQSTTSRIVPQEHHPPLNFWDGISAVWSSPSRLDCLVSEAQASSHLFLLGTRVTNIHFSAQSIFYNGYWGFNSHHRCSCLQGNHFDYLLPPVYQRFNFN